MSSRVYLELLAREASAVEFERPLLEARARAADPAEIEELEATKILALQVRSTLEHRRRRQAELTALFETAGDLAALRDVDAVLEAIVHRARQLLAADVAYLTFNDPDRGDTYMRVTDGSVSAAFQQVRLPFGTGLGGLVAQTARPYVTANYMDDERFRHTRTIDSAVSEEGLVAILGVPLLLGSRVLGVLFAANRHERPFSQDDVALVGSLAAHAAIALDTARLIEDTRAALHELSTTSRLLREHSESVERATAAHDRLTSVVLRGGGVDDVAAAVYEVLGGALRVFDSAGRTLAKIGTTGDEPDVAELAEAISRSRATGRVERYADTWVAAVVAGSEELGALVLDRRPDLGDGDRRSFERAALVTALLLLFGRSLVEAESRVRGELIDDLLAQPAVRDPEGLGARARHLGADLDAPHVVVVARAARGSRQQMSAAAAHLAAHQGGLAGERDGDTVLMLPIEDPEQAAQACGHALRPAANGAVTIGLAGPVHGLDALRSAVDEARRCVEVLVALGRTGQAASMADLGFVGLLLGRDRDVPTFVHTVIGPVIDYDGRRGTGLQQTLESYFAAGGSLARTAEALHVHVNTVTQRLERIRQLLGDDWQQPDRALEVQLALRLHRLAVRG